jgi:hypothetical protein
MSEPCCTAKLCKYLPRGASKWHACNQSKLYEFQREGERANCKGKILERIRRLSKAQLRRDSELELAEKKRESFDSTQAQARYHCRDDDSGLTR